jgi:Divergent InlB B-repeat domain
LKTTVLDDGEMVLADRLIIHYQPTTTDADRASVSHSGLGTVACRVGGASTGCSTPFPYGTTVTLTATGTSNPRLGIFWGFDHWEGACTGTVRTCTVTMTAARSVKAVFVDGS